MKYTRKDLLNIYNDSKENKLNNPELQKIKYQLHLICSNTNFEDDNLFNLIYILLELDNEKLNLIDIEFINFVIKITKMNYLKWMYAVIDVIQIILYDYSKLNTLKNFSYKLIWFNGLNDEDIITLKNYNEDLANVIIESREYIYNRSEKNDFIFPLDVSNDIFNKLVILFLSNPKKYNYDYSLPNKIANYILNNQEKFERIISYFYIIPLSYKKKDFELQGKTDLFIEMLLNYYSKNKLVSFEELKLKKELKKRNIFL